MQGNPKEESAFGQTARVLIVSNGLSDTLKATRNTEKTKRNIDFWQTVRVLVVSDGLTGTSQGTPL